MEDANYTVQGLRNAAHELQDISETELKKAMTGISGAGVEFAKHFKGGAAPGFFKRLDALENSILKTNRGLIGLASDIEQKIDAKRRDEGRKTDETGNKA